MRRVRLATVGGVVGTLAWLLVVAPAAQQRDPKQYQQTLERADRVAGLQVDKVIATLGVTPGMRVADLGAGSGVFTLPLARAAGPAGKVYAIDIDPGLLAIVADKAKAGGLSTVQTVEAGANEPRLPEPVDLIFICDTMPTCRIRASTSSSSPRCCGPAAASR